jgi:hypothetical protein
VTPSELLDADAVPVRWAQAQASIGCACGRTITMSVGGPP